MNKNIFYYKSSSSLCVLPALHPSNPPLYKCMCIMYTAQAATTATTTTTLLHTRPNT